MASFHDEIDVNKRNSTVLMLAVFAVTFSAVYFFSLLIFGDSILGFIISGIFASIYIWLSYTYADSLVLSISGAREARKDEFPYLVNVIEGLSLAAGTPTPKIYVIDDPALNAFATGTSPEKASVVFTTGLLNAMNRAELEGVAAHELSHIKNLDVRMATLVVVMVGLIAILSEFGIRSMFWGRGNRKGGSGILVVIGLLIIVVAPIVAQLVRLALSRQREYLADATGAKLTRYPEGLASALEKIKSMGSQVKKASDVTAPLYIANPLSVGQMFSTHPPIDERIKKLREM